MKSNLNSEGEPFDFLKYVKDLAPPPPAKGMVRHQYFLVVDGKYYDSLNFDQQCDLLDKAIGPKKEIKMLTELVLDTKEFVGFRYWIDLKEDDFPYTNTQIEGYQLIKDKINNPDKYNELQ